MTDYPPKRVSTRALMTNLFGLHRVLYASAGARSHVLPFALTELGGENAAQLRPFSNQ